MFHHFVSVYHALERGKTKSASKIHNKLVPPSYTSPNGTAKYAKYSMPACHFTGHNFWILKPTGLNRGRGIHVFKDLESLKEIIISYSRDGPISNKKIKDPLLNGFVIQKYIESPLLIHDRKFDIRMWALITADLDGYLFREGYVRTSSTKYDINTDDKNVDNKFMHLTNNAVQKYSESYGSFEDGNQMSFEKLAENLPKNVFYELILPQIKSLVKKSFLSVRRKINPTKCKNTFEIFGYDFILDADYNVWLIEVNTNPCLEESSALLKSLLPRMLDDAFKLTLDINFPKLKEYDAKSNLHKTYPIKGYEDDFNMWYFL